MNVKTSNSKRPMKVHECIRQGSGMHPKYHRPYPSATISYLTLYADRSGFLYREPLREVSP